MRREDTEDTDKSLKFAWGVCGYDPFQNNTVNVFFSASLITLVTPDEVRQDRGKNSCFNPPKLTNLALEPIYPDLP